MLKGTKWHLSVVGSFQVESIATSMRLNKAGKSLVHLVPNRNVPKEKKKKMDQLGLLQMNGLSETSKKDNDLDKEAPL